ncbi:BCCT family transporter [Oceanimonas sp. NS1]|nr:BCCT family transporter [Oceanimonas sp. NS1]
MTQQHTGNGQEGRLNLAVFHGSVAGILIFLIYTIAYTEHANALFNAGLDWIGQTFGWYYMLVITSYLVFVGVIGVSRFGKIRLGPDHSRPEFSLLSWSAMLFAAGIGGAILFFVVSEPLTHYLTPPSAPAAISTPSAGPWCKPLCIGAFRAGECLW